MGLLPPITLADAVKLVRSEVGDWSDTSDLVNTPPSHISRLELGTPATRRIDGVNTLFQVAHFPVLSAVPLSSVIQVQDDVGNPFGVSAAPPTNLTLGLINLTSAPASPAQAVFFTYFSIFYLDTDYIRWIQRAMEELGFTAVTSLTDQIGIDPRLNPALISFAKYLVYKMNATQTANFFDFSVGGKDEKKGMEAVNWEKLAAAELKVFQGLRDDPYKRQGRREAPAWAFSPVTNQQIYGGTR
jgi:hypothetical protein